MSRVFWQLGEGSLGDYDEADYAQSAREMLWWSDLNTPRWNGMEFLDKPPLCQWLTVLSYKVFGVNEFGARAVAAFSGVLAIVLTYLLGHDLFGGRATGFGAALILMTISHNLFSHGYNFLSLARVGMLDMPLILLMMLSVWLVWRGTTGPHHRRGGYLTAVGVPLGLGLMTKSIAGFLAYGIVALYLLLAVPRKVWWRRELLWGLLLSVALAAPWHLGQLFIWGEHFWNSYMVSLTVGYVTGDQGHTKDWLFYFRSMQRGFPQFYPVVALAVIYAVGRVARQLPAARLAPDSADQTNGALLDKGRLLLLCWVAVPMILYNISRSRIGWYMIPIYPALALLTVSLLVEVVHKLIPCTLLQRMASIFGWGGTINCETSSWLLVAVIACLTFALNPRMPRVNDFNPDVKRVAQFGHYVVPDDAVLVNYWPGSFWIRPSALFYADRPMLFVYDERALRRLFSTQGEFYLLVQRDHWEPFSAWGDIVYQSGEYLLTRVSGKNEAQLSLIMLDGRV